MTTTKRHKWHAWYDVFLACIREGASTSVAAELAGVERHVIYDHADRHPAFRSAWKEAECVCDTRIRIVAQRMRANNPNRV